VGEIQEDPFRLLLPVLQSESFKTKAELWMRQPDIFKWDTSPLKVVDNLIIGLSKENHAEQGVARDAPQAARP